ncbi:tetratricopeptide repeat protein [Streptomyces sp. MBT53]|uniref:tetratricopeptide repeat protein n=1 Tax=Streptomyces sp. MBT53 TaxID=1488384 RepID=UPI001913A8A0|nr:tetratricopeptide repeat protein [Streptomyces sp. MBT53]MBK6016337.1 tetratricopeptide repeat protein [Streptomyces sp. MBT53]
MATAALPAVPAGFTGRDEDLARLFPVLDPATESDLPVVICAVSGLGGIGKTSLALCAAHRAVRDGWFPGGTLFVDFRGYDEDPVTADQAVVALLDGMGVRGADLPQTVTGQYGLYRRLLAEERRSMLLVLDNASDAGQVMPLVPGTDHHRVLVTSRDRLTDLEAQLIDLDVLNTEGATDLINRSLRLSDRSDDRATREPEPVSELATLCGHHPLALKMTAGMLRRRRHRSVASLVDELRGAEDRTAALGLRPLFEAAYRQLPSAQARLLRLLALAPAAEVGSETAAALADLGVDQTFALLEELAAAHLVTPVPGGADVRWRLHDLVRVFGVGVVKGDAELWEEGEAARERVLAFYHRWARAADGWLRWPPGKSVSERFVDRAGALAWLDSERAGLVAAVQWAREERYADTAVRLSQCLGEYLYWRRSFDDWITVCGVAREAAHRAGNRMEEAIAWNSLGAALRETGQAEEAIVAHIRARDLFQTVGDRLREAIAWNNLGLPLREADRVEEAIDAHTRALDLYKAAGDRPREAIAWNNLGLALRQAGRVEEAIDAHTRALDLYKAVGDRHGEARAWNNLGATLQKAARLEEEVEAYEKALEGFRDFDDWYETGRTLYNLALAHQHAARPTEARAHYLQSAAAYTRANAPADAAYAQSRADALT